MTIIYLLTNCLLVYYKNSGIFNYKDLETINIQT